MNEIPRVTRMIGVGWSIIMTITKYNYVLFQRGRIDGGTGEVEHYNNSMGLDEMKDT